MGRAQSAREGPRGVQAGAPSLRHVVRVAQRVLRSEHWGSYEVTMSTDSVSVRVHRATDGKETAKVPESRVPRGTLKKALPSAPTLWKDMSKKERRGIQAQRRGMLNRFARRGVLSDWHPARSWVRFAKTIAAALSDVAVSPVRADMELEANRQKRTNSAEGTSGAVDVSGLPTPQAQIPIPRTWRLP